MIRGAHEDVNELVTWYTATNMLPVNLDKCEILPFSSSKPDKIQMMRNDITTKTSANI